MLEVQSVETQQSYILSLLGVHGWEQQSGAPPLSPSGAFSQKFAIELPHIRFDGTFFELNSPLCVLLWVEDESWVCEDEGKHITSFGDSSERALHSFCEDFSVLWEQIANEDDEVLTTDARQVKDFLISIVHASRAE